MRLPQNSTVFSFNKKRFTKYQPKSEIMKIFETVRNNLKFIGYTDNRYPFTTRQMLLLLQSCLGTFSIGVQLFYYASTSGEYMNCIFMFMVGILAFMSEVSTALKMPTIFIFIRSFENIIGQSELVCLHKLYAYKSMFNSL